MKNLILLICLLFIQIKSFSQTIPTGDSFLNNIARRDQVSGISQNAASFSIRPISVNDQVDSSLLKLVAGKNLFPNFKVFSAPSSVQLLPISWLNDYNVNRPYGYNNGSLYPSAGYQTRVSAGIYISAGILKIQLKPELVYAQNKSFKTFPDEEANSNDLALWKSYFNMVNGIDAPERFGDQPLHHLYPGQSKITINVKNIEAGLSTENLWWGPGVQNSIMMSNSAPGFLHLTLNSVVPVKTKIGSFEWQIIGGKLDQSGYPPLDTAGLTIGKGLYIAKPRVSRYISAFTVNWQPKWAEGLYVGFTKYDYLNRDSSYNGRNIFRKLFPVITGSSLKQNAISSTSNGDGQDFAFAFNVRQVFVKYKAEIYFEWARNDDAANTVDFLQEPEHSSAYTLGGSRMFDLSKDQFLQFKFELTHLQNPPTYLLRAEPTWYVHLVDPRDGYTNDGRYVGAGIGPGSNSLMFDISFLQNLNSYGITLERLVHNNDLYYDAFMGTGTFNRHWVDIANTFYANFKLKRYIISTELTPVYSLNYEYNSGNSFNLHARVSLTYYFD